MELEHVEHRPHPVLRPLLAQVTGYRQAGMPAGVHRGLPSPWLTLVVPLDAPLVVAAHADPAQGPGSYDALVGGLHTRPVLIAHPGHQEGVQLSLTPLGARALLGMPAAALASWDAPLEDVVGCLGRELVTRLRQAPDWRSRFAALEDVLLPAVRHQEALVPEVTEAWRLTTAGHGGLRVEDVARRVGWSPRRLQQAFRAELGLTPKEAARVARFDRARRLLPHVRADLAAFAVSRGYYDQSHLTREWRAFAGLPPTAWLAAEFASVQDGAGRLPSSSTA